MNIHEFQFSLISVKMDFLCLLPAVAKENIYLWSNSSHFDIPWLLYQPRRLSLSNEFNVAQIHPPALNIV